MALKFTNVLVETSLVGNMSAGKLKHTFSTEGMFEGFFTDGTFATDKGSLTTVPRAVDFYDSSHVGRIWGTNGQVALRPVCRVTTEGAKRAKGRTSGGIWTGGI